jgi:hypothetical protein
MNEQQQIPMLPAERPTDEHKQLVTLFAEMEGKQLDFLDQAGKSLIERIAALLAVLFAVIAFGSNFPPKYLVGNAWAKALVVVVLGFYLLAMGLGLMAIQPRSYNLYRENVTRMRSELERILSWKKSCIWLAGIMFALGTVALAALIVLIIVPV